MGSAEEHAIALVNAGEYEETVANKLKAIIMKTSDEILNRIHEIPADRLASVMLGSLNVHQAIEGKPNSTKMVIGLQLDGKTLTRDELIKSVNGKDRAVNEEIILDPLNIKRSDSASDVAHIVTQKGHNNPSTSDSAHIKSTGKPAVSPINIEDE